MLKGQKFQVDLGQTNELLKQIVNNLEQLRPTNHTHRVGTYAALISTGLLLIQLARWWKSKKRLKIKTAIGVSIKKNKTYKGWFVIVTNKSPIPITVNRIDYTNKLGIRTVTTIGDKEKPAKLQPEHSRHYFIKDSDYPSDDVSTVLVEDSAGDVFKAKMGAWGYGPIGRKIVLTWRRYKHRKLMKKIGRKKANSQ